jgi:NAD(P)-dependent dehydrogenase (short-subunit alcohol dehydrogenase family)
MELSGKIAIITGGSNGIGRATAELFVREGANVVIADVNAEAGEALAMTLGSAAAFKRTDVSKREEVQALVDFAVETFGGLHAMCNNAGISDDAFGPLLETDFPRFESIMAINVLGTMLGTQIAGRHMARNGGGSIVNTSSISGIQPGFGFFSYRASKAAIVNFTKTAAIELGVHLIRVNCICPGNIPTEMGTYAATPGMSEAKAQRIKSAIGDVRMGWQPLKRQGSPRDIAEAALFFACDRSRQTTAQILSVDGGATAGTAKSMISEIMAARAQAEAEGD